MASSAWNLALAPAALLLAAIAVGSANTAEPTAGPVFERDVLPILNAHCLQCHGGVHQKNGLALRTLPKVLTPEQLYDSLCVALEVADLAPPPDPKAKKPNPKAPPPPSLRAVFVAAFRGPGEVYEPTELKLGVPQALKLMNQENFNNGGKVVERLAEGDRPASEVIEGLFLAALARKPTVDEREKFAAFVARQKSPRDGYSRVLWVLINSSEFLLNH